MTIRTATVEDATAIREIYAPYVEKTAITFEYDVPSREEMERRISETLQGYPYIVAEENGEIKGYAYAQRLGERAAFLYSVETSIYLKQSERKRGLGRMLYAALEDRLRQQGVKHMYASIAWTDEPTEYITDQSIRFHQQMGFKQCGQFHRCGFKFGIWLDLVWMEKTIEI